MLFVTWKDISTTQDHSSSILTWRVKILAIPTPVATSVSNKFKEKSPKPTSET